MTKQWIAVEPQPYYTQQQASENTIWVCRACGKTTKDRYNGPRGWDGSCVLNSVLCYDETPSTTTEEQS